MRRGVTDFIAQQARVHILIGTLRGLRRCRASDPRVEEEELQAMNADERRIMTSLLDKYEKL
jgi:hypothetical protein